MVVVTGRLGVLDGDGATPLALLLVSLILLLLGVSNAEEEGDVLVVVTGRDWLFMFDGRPGVLDGDGAPPLALLLLLLGVGKAEKEEEREDEEGVGEREGEEEGEEDEGKEESEEEGEGEEREGASCGSLSHSTPSETLQPS